MRVKEKEALVKEMQKILGRVPNSTREVLSILVHKDLIALTKDYIERFDIAAQCQKYKAPWSCVREAEASYKSIKFGWLGGASNIGLDESWCVTCRARVMGEEDDEPISASELARSLSYDERRILGLTDKDGC